MNPSTELSVRPNGGNVAVVRQEFGATELTAQHETAAMAVAAREKASVEARYIMAIQRPRNIDQFRVNLLHACKRPGFASKAEYAKPIGKELVNGEWVEKKARGSSIRFVETALQMYGNVYPETATVFDNSQARICRVSVTDLETNITYVSEVVVTKTVERKGKKQRDGSWTPPEGRTVIDQRVNSYGDATFIVSATDDEVMVKQNALLSKALRTTALRILPYDIVEEAMSQAKQTVANEAAQDPDAAKRRLVDAFAGLGVQPIDLEAYLGHSLNKPLSPAERDDLLGIHSAIKEGETTWQEVMFHLDGGGSEDLQKEKLEEKLRVAAEEKARQQKAPEEPVNPGPVTPEQAEAVWPSSPSPDGKPRQVPTFGRPAK